MYVISESAARTTTTAGGTMIGLAAPSQGAAELSSWRIRMPEGAQGPLHTIDREQVWMPVAGELEVTVDGGTALVGAGQAVVLPAGAPRQVRAVSGPAEALVCMVAGGMATVAGNDARHRLPWAE